MQDRAVEPKNRYDALDCVRAAAMLLGVLYHAVLFGQMASGGGPPMMMPGRGFRLSSALMDWLHSFRMPLFFLIAGFFCRMMYFKYGLGGYLARRWVRIGLPLLIGLFTLVPLYELNSPMGGGGRGPGRGGPPGGGPGGPMPMGMPLPGGGGPGGPGAGFGDELPPPPAGFVPPPLAPFDVNNDGTIDAAEWTKAREQIAKDMAAGGGFGPPGGGGFGPPGGGGFGPPGGGGGGGILSMFRLDFLWFLWYLLVFATAAPLVTWILGLVFDRPARRWGSAAFDRNLAPVLLAVVSLPALLITGGFMGWQLPLAAGIFRSFPAFLISLEIDMPFYFTYFLFGWWLHRERQSLSSVARHWWISLAVGIALHAGAMWLSASYSMQRDHAQYQAIRTGCYILYTLGSAFSAFGFLGFFQKYVQRPSKVGRYLADTAFWVYLLHEPVMMPILNALSPLRWPWWVQGPTVAVLTTLIALVLYETIVRPTPLVLLFGPSLAKPKPVNPMPQRDIDLNEGVQPA